MNLRINIAIFLLCYFWDYSGCAVQPPRILAKSAVPLEYITVEVNGALKKVAVNRELAVVEGDQLLIKSAILYDPRISAANVNLVGFVSPIVKRSAEDRGVKISTSTDLMKKWSVDPEGELYRVEAFTGKHKHGQVFLRVLKPVLKYVEVLINGEPKILREGEFLTVKATDTFKVKSVKSNIENDHEEVSFQMVPMAPELELSGKKFYEIRFTRNKKVFAKISMQIVEGA